MKVAVKAFAIIVVLCAISSLCRADLEPLKVVGPNLVSNGHVVRLRGIDWGWWHIKAAKYRESDMQDQAGWGANVARLCVSYTDVEDPNNHGKLDENRVKDVDEVISWAKKYNQYVIIDMHVAPGGQDTQGYCDGGKNLLWKDADDQQRLISLWEELAERYRNDPTVAAYEIMNEPCTQGQPPLLISMYKRTLAAIRSVDPGKMVVIGGDEWSGAKQLKDDIKLNDPNILYTFHFYDGLPSPTWLSNAPEGAGISGTQDWTKIDVPIDVPKNAISMAILLRSVNNSGSAWFDDVTLTDSGGNVVNNYTFDANTEQFHVERKPLSDGEYDPSAGHDKPGSLKVSGTTSYNAFISKQITVSPGREYHLSAWVKLDKATGHTYLSAAFFGITTSSVDHAKILQLMQPAVDFGKKYNVPIWVGEFGCPVNGLPSGLQENWVHSAISAFEANNFDWTYWNYRESSGPAGMSLHAEHSQDSSDYPINEALLQTLKEGWQLNSQK